MAGLYNGGPAAIVYGIIVSAAGNLAIASSLAELASVWGISCFSFRETESLHSEPGILRPEHNTTGAMSLHHAILDFLASFKVSLAPGTNMRTEHLTDLSLGRMGYCLSPLPVTPAPYDIPTRSCLYSHPE